MSENVRKPRLDSGNKYSLKELFSGDNDKIVIPDLQRDYCWGGSSSDLVGKFMDTILGLDRSKEITMGLIYGYVNTELTVEHVQLCDGQQRLTTLFLLAGVINRKTHGRFKHLLMSSFEDIEDDQEPYLQYSIRESSLYFLSDFTKKYFLTEGPSFDFVTEQAWFLKSYEQDPTIASILSAVKRIEQKLADETEEDLTSLGTFISEKLKFLYYDMKNRRNGEETFVVINTTGEPLSANQNLKPLFIKKNTCLIDGKASDVIWEEMETWFWRNRNRDAKTPHTSDEGMTAFLQTAALVNAFNIDNDRPFEDGEDEDTSEEAQKKLSTQFGTFSRLYDQLTNPDRKAEGAAINYSVEISLDNLWKLFKAYKRIYPTDFSERLDNGFRYDVPSNTACGYTQKQLYVLLPALAYCLRYPEAGEENIRRIVHIFRVISLCKDLSRPLTPTLRALISISGMKEPDPLSLKDVMEFKRYKEECVKLDIIANELARRKDVEILLARAEAHEIFVEANDSIMTLIDWGKGSFDAIKTYYDRFSSLWTVRDYKALTGNLDTLRLALVAFHLNNYPIDGEKLCFDRKEWYAVISNNRDRIKEFIDTVFDANSPKSLDSIISEALDSKDSSFTPSMRTFLSDRSLVKFCEYKRVKVGQHCIEVLRSLRRFDFRVIFNGILYQTKKKEWKDDTLRKYTDNILFLDFGHYNLTVDFTYDDNDGYRIIVWEGKYKGQKTFEHFDELSGRGFEPYDKGDKGFALPLITDHQTAHDKLFEIIEWVEERL